MTTTTLNEPFRHARRVGVTLTTLGLAFLFMDAAGKLASVPEVVAATTALGYPASVVRPLGATLFICACLTAMPRLSVLGTLLCTAYLGGAVATHVRVGNPLLTHTLFPVYLAAFLWAGLWLRSERVRHMLPLTRP